MEKVFERKPGDEVWVMYGNKAVRGHIKSVFFCTGISCVDRTSVRCNEMYTLCYAGGDMGNYKLSDMFSTKEELIRSL